MDHGSHISGSLYISAKCQFSNNEIVYSLKTFTFFQPIISQHPCAQSIRHSITSPDRVSV